MTKSEPCRSCKAPIIWVQTAASGKWQPLDANPEKRVILNREGKAQVVEAYMPHHATCPDADDWRKGKAGA